MLGVSEIDWIEAAGNYAQLWVGRRSYFHREPLHLLEERLRRHGFLRAHRRALVRLDGVRELTRDQAGVLEAVLGGGARIPISRRRSAAFAAAMRQAGKPRSMD
jgi:two-component system LytT family response regulator